VDDLVSPPGLMREDLEAFVKLEEYAREYLKLAKTQKKKY